MRAFLPSTKRLLNALMQVTEERNALARERDALKAQVEELTTGTGKGPTEAKNASAVIGPSKGFIEQINELTRRVNELTGRVNELTGRVNELTGERNALTARNNELTYQVNALTGERNELVGKINELTGERNSLVGEVNKLNYECDRLLGKTEGRVTHGNSTLN
jgi:uncharacterized coiled-coil DUF342 family protein